MNNLSKLPDKIKQAKEEGNKKEEESFGISGVWRCGYCGIEFEQVIHPYYSNIPVLCMTRKCISNELNLKNRRFIFIKWKIFK